MTQPKVQAVVAPQLHPVAEHGSVEDYVQMLRRPGVRNGGDLRNRVLGHVDSIAASSLADAETWMARLRNLLAAEQIVRRELDAAAVLADQARLGQDVKAYAEYAPEGRTTAVAAMKPDTLGVAMGHHGAAEVQSERSKRDLARYEVRVRLERPARTYWEAARAATAAAGTGLGMDSGPAHREAMEALHAEAVAEDRERFPETYAPIREAGPTCRADLGDVLCGRVIRPGYSHAWVHAGGIQDHDAVGPDQT